MGWEYYIIWLSDKFIESYLKTKNIINLYHIWLELLDIG